MTKWCLSFSLALFYACAGSPFSSEEESDDAGASSSPGAASSGSGSGSGGDGGSGAGGDANEAGSPGSVGGRGGSSSSGGKGGASSSGGSSAGQGGASSSGGSGGSAGSAGASGSGGSGGTGCVLAGECEALPLWEPDKGLTTPIEVGDRLVYECHVYEVSGETPLNDFNAACPPAGDRESWCDSSSYVFTFVGACG